MVFSKLWEKLDEYEQEHGSNHKVSFGPADVRKLIERALTSGWSLTLKNGVFKIRGLLDLKDYKLPEPCLTCHVGSSWTSPRIDG